jgi:hypothetical protein
MKICDKKCEPYPDEIAETVDIRGVISIQLVDLALAKAKRFVPWKGSSTYQVCITLSLGIVNIYRDSVELVKDTRRRGLPVIKEKDGEEF